MFMLLSPAYSNKLLFLNINNMNLKKYLATAGTFIILGFLHAMQIHLTTPSEYIESISVK